MSTPKAYDCDGSLLSVGDSIEHDGPEPGSPRAVTSIDGENLISIRYSKGATNTRMPSTSFRKLSPSAPACEEKLCEGCGTSPAPNRFGFMYCGTPSGSVPLGCVEFIGSPLCDDCYKLGYQERADRIRSRRAGKAEQPFFAMIPKAGLSPNDYVFKEGDYRQQESPEPLTLAAFTALAEKMLLPKGWRVVCDTVTDLWDPTGLKKGFVCFVLDESGRQFAGCEMEINPKPQQVDAALTTLETRCALGYVRRSNEEKGG